MHGDRGEGIGGLGETEHLAVLLVDPVAQILHAVLVLGLQVGPVRPHDILDRRALGKYPWTSMNGGVPFSLHVFGSRPAAASL